MRSRTMVVHKGAITSFQHTDPRFWLAAISQVAKKTSVRIMDLLD